jgi:hypothetical protein
MNSGKHFLLGAVVLLAAGQVAAPAQAPSQKSRLTEQQRKDLKQLETTLGSPPATGGEAAKRAQKVRNQFWKVVSASGQPTRQSADRLAATLLGGVNAGAVSVDQSVRLAEAVAGMLSQPVITYRDMRQFLQSIEPVVQNTRLDVAERSRLYREALLLVESAGTYADPRR